jgi:predicted porin
MKKSLFAIAAVTAFAGAAQAQSSVTVYGIYDGGWSSSNLKESSATNVKTNTQLSGYTGGESATSRIGFRGNEVLGGGTSAMFNLELGIAAGTGTVGTTTVTLGATQGSDSNSVRTSIVGLTNKQFGSVAVGRQLTGMHGILAGDVWGGNNMAGDITYHGTTSTAAGAGATATGRINSITTRSSNMLTYTSPTFMGAQLRLDQGNTESTAVNQPSEQFALTGAYVTYNYKQFTAKAGQVRAKSNAALAATAPYAAQTVVVNGANLMFRDKGLTVQYTIGNNKVETLNATTTAYASGVRAQKLSASYQMGAVMPFVQYGIGGSEGVRTAANTATEDKAYQIGVEYSLSKRSALYAAYGVSDRKNKVNSAMSTEYTDMAVGLRHTF